jgi:hypothetical protein
MYKGLSYSPQYGSFAFGADPGPQGKFGMSQRAAGSKLGHAVINLACPLFPPLRPNGGQS